jgi:hypothetical protein
VHSWNGQDLGVGLYLSIPLVVLHSKIAAFVDLVNNETGGSQLC